MKLTFTGKPTSIRRPKEFSIGEFVEIDLEMKGNAEVPNQAAKPAKFKGTLLLKPLLADKLAFGTTFTITVDDSVVETKPEPIGAN